MLPMNKLSRRLQPEEMTTLGLQPEEMTTLAVKTNAALLNSLGSGKCRKKTGFFEVRRMISSAKVFIESSVSFH